MNKKLYIFIHKRKIYNNAIITIKQSLENCNNKNPELMSYLSGIKTGLNFALECLEQSTK